MLTTEQLVEWSFSPLNLCWSPLDVTICKHNSFYHRIICSYTTFEKYLWCRILNVFYILYFYVLYILFFVCLMKYLKLSIYFQLWIFYQSNGSARLLRSRCGHSAPPTRLRFSTGEAIKILSTGSYSIPHSSFPTPHLIK